MEICEVNRRTTMRSITLEIKGKFETERYELKLFASGDGFFSRGKTVACLRSVGNIPDWRERLQIWSKHYSHIIKI